MPNTATAPQNPPTMPTGKQVILVKAQETPWFVWLGLLVGGYLILHKSQSTQDAEDGRKRNQLRTELYGGAWTFAPPADPAAVLQAIQARQSTLVAVAKALKDAKGIFNDDESAVLSAFRNLRSRYEVKTMADGFAQGYGPDLGIATLGQWLDGFLTDENWGPIVRLINSMPVY